MANRRIRGEQPKDEDAVQATGEVAGSVEGATTWTRGQDEERPDTSWGPTGRVTPGETRIGTNVGEAGGFTFEQQDVTPDLDPQLQHVLLSARAGRIDRTLVEESEDGKLR